MRKIDTWSDVRYITDHAGQTVTVWSYKPRDGERIADGAAFSGSAPGNVALFADAMARHGHAILEAAGSRPWHHHVASCGMGHDDARFAESGDSMAAYYESGEAFGGRWWDRSVADLGRLWELLNADERSHLACCGAVRCARCALLTGRVMQLVAAPVERCACGFRSRDLAHRADGSPVCHACRTAEVFA